MLSLLFSTFLTIQTNPIKVGVIEQSIDKATTEKVTLCQDGMFNISTIDKGIAHAANILGIITDKAKNSNYCLHLAIVGTENGMDITSALYYFTKNKVDVLNISAGGLGYSEKEHSHIKTILAMGTKIVASAGNNGLNLEKDCVFYPACYDSRIIVVGNKNHYTSNYGGPVDIFVNGIDRTGFDVTLTGTSQAAAVVTGHLIRIYDKQRNVR